LTHCLYKLLWPSKWFKTEYKYHNHLSKSICAMHTNMHLIQICIAEIFLFLYRPKHTRPTRQLSEQFFSFSPRKAKKQKGLKNMT
jgi:hypothetical protein